MSIEATLAICAIASATTTIFSILAAALTMNFASARTLQILVNLASYSLGLAIGFAAGTAVLIGLD